MSRGHEVARSSGRGVTESRDGEVAAGHEASGSRDRRVEFLFWMSDGHIRCSCPTAGERPLSERPASSQRRQE